MRVELFWGGYSAPVDYKSPLDFIAETQGRIVGIKENNARVTIGKFHLYYLDVEAAFNEGIDVYDVFDAYHETESYYDFIFGENAPDFSDELVALLDCAANRSNVLIVDRLTVLSKYQGHSVGLTALWTIIRRFGSCAGIVAMRPYPLQFEHEAMHEQERQWQQALDLGRFEKNFESATAKLESHYARLDFVKAKDTGFMVRSNTIRLPLDRVMIGAMRGAAP